MRSMFGEHVLNYPMLKSTAIVRRRHHQADALRGRAATNSPASTYDRAIEALDNVNGEIEQLIRSGVGEGRNGAKKSPCRTDR